MRRWIAAVVMGAAFCGVTLTAGATALAHAAFESSNPAAGAVVPALPDVVELTFTEIVGLPSVVAVTDPSGVNVETGDLSAVDRTASQAISVSDPQPGAYVIAYEVASVDGHPISGTVTFTLDAPATPAATPIAATTTVPAATASADADASSATTVLAAAASGSPTSGGSSDGPQTMMIVLLLIAAAGATIVAGCAVRRAVRQMTVSVETTVA